MANYNIPEPIGPRAHCRTIRPDELTPGSDGAIDAGCSCDPRRNRHGSGEPSIYGGPLYYIDAGCRLHQQRPRVPPAAPSSPEMAPPAVVHHCVRCGRELPRVQGRPPKIGECCLTAAEKKLRDTAREYARRKAERAKAAAA